MNIEEIRKELTRKEFIDKIGLDFIYNNETFSCPDDLGLEKIHDNENDDCHDCNGCWTKAIKNIKFKDELEDIHMEEEKSNESYNVDELLNQIEKFRKKIVDLNRDNENIADRVHNEALRDLKEITQQYESRIDELRAKIQYLESLQSPICDCVIDTEAERKHYKFITNENIRLKNVIKLLSESL